MAEALCPEPLPQQVPAPFISKSSSTPTNTQRKEKAKCLQKTWRVPKGWSSLLWASPRGVEVPVPFTSKSNTTPDEKTYKNKKIKCSRKKTRVPKGGWSSLPWASPRGVELPIPFILKSNATPDKKTAQEKKTKCLHKKTQNAQRFLKLFALSFSYRSWAPSTFHSKMKRHNPTNRPTRKKDKVFT